MNHPPPHPSYVADDAKITTDSLHFLHTPAGQQLLLQAAQRAAPNHSPAVADVAALRKHFDAPAVHAAFALLRLQQNALAKFPRLPFLWATPEALEQATDHLVARHKALRYAAANPSAIWDLCAGIGGDTMALAQIAPVTAVDLSPPRLLCLAFNLENLPRPFPVTSLLGDVQTLTPSSPPADAAFHIDPARRTAGKRSPRFEDLLPGPTFLGQLTRRFSAGGIKLSSAVDFDTLPAGHLELISHRRVVVQAMLWTGRLADPFPPLTRTATILHEPAHEPANESVHELPYQLAPPFSLTARPAPVTTTPADALPLSAGILFEADGALTRASLAAPFAQSHGLHALTTDGGYLWGTQPLTHPALVPFSVLQVLPFSHDKVANALRLMPGPPGPVEVKTRGGLPGVDTDALQRAWSKAAPARRTVLIFRTGKDVLAVIAQRLKP